MAQSLPYAFFLNMWIMNRIDASFLAMQVNYGRITQAEADMILATPQA